MTPHKVLKTQVFTSTTQNTTTQDSTSWAKLDAPQWTYTKVSPTSYLVITYQDTLGLGSFGLNTYLMYQVRVNDQPSVSGESSAVLCVGGNNSYCATGVWLGVPQGDAILSIWHRQYLTTGYQNSLGSLGVITTLIVMEIEK